MFEVGKLYKLGQGTFAFPHLANTPLLVVEILPGDLITDQGYIVFLKNNEKIKIYARDFWFFNEIRTNV